MDSQKILETIKAEQSVNADLHAKLLLAKGEVEKAELIRRRVSHAALAGEDPKALKQLEAAEEVIAKSEQRFKSTEAAIAESERRQADLQTQHDTAVKEERWTQNIVDPFKKELANAVEIDKHFTGKGSTQPLTTLIREYLDALHVVTRHFAYFHITPPIAPTTVLQRWLQAQLHGAGDFKADRWTRDRFAGTYAEALRRVYDKNVSKREQPTQTAVNE